MGGSPVNPAIDLLDGRFYARVPEAEWAWLRANAPVYWDEPRGLWGVALHADVQRVSKDPDVFCSSGSSRPDAPAIPSMINMDDPLHKRRRNLVNRGFTPRRVADHEPRIRAICRELIAKVAPRGRCDFVKEIAAPPSR